MKAKVLGGFLSSKGLLRCNVVVRKHEKIIKSIAYFLWFEYTKFNRVARSFFDIGDQDETYAQLFYVDGSVQKTRYVS